MTDFTMKAGDTKPLTATLVGMDLSGADTFVLFSMKTLDGVVVVDEKRAEPIAGELGKVRYVWASGETDVPGHYLGEFVVVDAGEIQTAPSSGQLSILLETRVGTNPLQALDIEAADIVVQVGQTLNAAIQAFLRVGSEDPLWVTDQVVWSGPVNPPMVAIDGQGNVTGLAPGTARVRATFGLLFDEVDVVVTA